MKAVELANELLKYPDFDLEFIFTDGCSELPPHFPNMRKFNSIEVADIGHSSKLLLLSGEEVD